MSEAPFDIELFCKMISDFWGTFRNSEKSIEGIKKEFRYLTDKELEELWIFIKSKSEHIKNPTASIILKMAKDHNYRIRKSNVNKMQSVYVCGACECENPMESQVCKECGHNLCNLPAVCVCGYKFKDVFQPPDKNGIVKNNIGDIRMVCPRVFENGKRCGRARESGSVKRIII